MGSLLGLGPERKRCADDRALVRGDSPRTPWRLGTRPRYDGAGRFRKYHHSLFLVRRESPGGGVAQLRLHGRSFQMAVHLHRQPIGSYHPRCPFSPQDRPTPDLILWNPASSTNAPNPCAANWMESPKG